MLPLTITQVYPQYRSSRKSWGINALGTLVVEVEDERGNVGVGVTVGGGAGCQLVEGHLSRFVEGQDPRDVQLMWDQMFRATLNYGRKGLPLQAISAVDLALWDLLGKVSSGLQHVSSNHRLNWLRHSSPKTQLFLLTVFRWYSNGSK